MKRAALAALIAAPIFIAADCEGPRVRGVALSPDGRRVAFLYKKGLYLSRTDAPAAALASRAADAVGAVCSWAADSERVAFVSDQAGSWDVWLYDVRTRSAKPLTTHLAKDWDPVLVSGPKGGRCFFLSTRSRRTDVWTTDLRGGRPKPVTDDALVEFGLSASRDGSVLAYQAADDAGAVTLTVRWLDSSASASCAPPARPVGPARVSPDGRRLAFAAGGALYVARLKPGRIGEPDAVLKLRGPAPPAFAWSPDSRALAAAGRGALRIRSLRWFARNRRLPGLRAAGCVSWSGNAIACGVREAVVWASLKAPDEPRWIVPNADAAAWAAKEEDRRNRRETALALARLAAGQTDDEAARRLLGEELMRTGRLKEAADVFETLGGDWPLLAKLRVAAGRPPADVRDALRRVPAAERTEELKEIGEAAAEFSRPDARPRWRAYGAAWRALLASEPERAAALWRKCARRFPKDSRWRRRSLLHAAEAYAQAGDRGEAVDAYKNWLKHWPHAPESPAARMRLAALYVEAGKIDAAVEQYRLAARAGAGRMRVDARLALARLYPDKLPDAPQAAAAADAAIDAARKLGDAGAERLLEAWVESVRVRLDQPAACAQAAARLAALARPSEAVADAVGKTVQLMDEAGLTFEANQALRALLPLIPKSRVFPALVTPESGYLARRLGVRRLIQCDLGHLPLWFDERALMLAAYLNSDPVGGSEEERFALRVLTAQRPEEVVAALKPWRARLRAHPEDQPARDIVRLGCYVLGNFHQTRRRFADALNWYERLARASEEEAARDYLPTLQECRARLPAQPHVVRQWLDAERLAGRALWEPAAALRRLEIGSDPERLRAARREAVAAYETFFRKHRALSLADDALLRLAQIDEPRRWRWAKRFVQDFPGSRHFPAALSLFADAARKRCTPWLAATFLQEIASNPAYAQAAPFIELEIGRLYEDRLKRFDLARPHLERVDKEFASSPAWPEAAKRLAMRLFAQRRWKEAAARIDLVRRRRPDFAWAASGEAAWRAGEAWERAGEWPRAEAAYVEAILRGRELEPVRDGSLLARILPRLSPSALDQIHAREPGDLRRLLPRLSPSSRKALAQRYPDLADRQ